MTEAERTEDDNPWAPEYAHQLKEVNGLVATALELCLKQAAIKDTYNFRTNADADFYFGVMLDANVLPVNARKALAILTTAQTLGSMKNYVDLKNRTTRPQSTRAPRFEVKGFT